jgi:hypothetical protein
MKRQAHKKTRKPQGKPARRRRNPDGALDAAAALSESFHGKPADRVTVIQEEEHEYAAVAELGKLVELHVRTADGKRFRLPFLTAGVRVCATPDGNNIVFLGGDQEIDLASLGIETDKDQLPLGECTGIVYTTKKAFHNFQKTDYVHKFGEESGEPPILGYSPLNSRIYLEGGRYQVRPEGIVD